MTTQTNASTPALAAKLAETRHGSFVGLVIKKKGDERGRGADKKRFGDDRVHAVIVTGFSYTNLCQRSLDMLAAKDPQAVFDAIVASGKTPLFTVADLELAKAELIESYGKSVAGTNESTTDGVFEPLVVNGEVVRGSRVYVGPGDPSDPKAPVTGTVYLQGLQVGSKVLEAAANGPVPAAASAGKTLARKHLTKDLPVARYVSYPLPAGGDWFLRSGGAEIAAAVSDEVEIDMALLTNAVSA